MSYNVTIEQYSIIDSIQILIYLNQIKIYNWEWYVPTPLDYIVVCPYSS